jgi:antitoxin (DNA-binding transcriptional repressor) of toxin-antitoxin stability system
MRTITATQFRNELEAIFRWMSETGESVIVTRRGKRYAQLAPIIDGDNDEDSSSIFPRILKIGVVHVWKD